MPPDKSRHLQMTKDESRWLQLAPDGSRSSDGSKSCRQANSYRKSIGWLIGLRRVCYLSLSLSLYIYIYTRPDSTTDHIKKAPNVTTEVAELEFCARQVDNSLNSVSMCVVSWNNQLAKPHQIKSTCMEANRIDLNQIKSERINSDRIKSNMINSNHLKTHRIKRIACNRIKSNWI